MSNLEFAGWLMIAGLVFMLGFYYDWKEMKMMILIKKWGKYKVKGKSEYFKRKYDTYNPEFVLETEDIKIWGKSWMNMDGNPAALLYGMRAGTEGIPLQGKVYYGHIESLGELVHESELEEILEGGESGCH